MEIDWKDILKWVPVVAVVLLVLGWLFTPADPAFNAKKKP